MNMSGDATSEVRILGLESDTHQRDGPLPHPNHPLHPNLALYPNPPLHPNLALYPNPPLNHIPPLHLSPL